MRGTALGAGAVSLALGAALLATTASTATAQQAPAAGVRAERASYSQDAAGRVVLDVFARSAPGQALGVRVAGRPAAVPMRSQADRYYARIPVPVGAATPATVTVTNTTDVPATSAALPVTDVVTIGRAVYDATARTLTVAASSSDQSAPPAVTVRAFGVTTAAGATFPGVQAPPASVAVTSAAGGAATARVVVTAPPAPQPADTLRVTEARYRAEDREWRVEGTSTAPVGTAITVRTGRDLTGPVLGVVRVDSDREWELRQAGSATPRSAFVSVSSAAGGRVLAVPVTDED